MQPALSDEALQQLLREEAPYGDLSTLGLGLSEQPGSVTLAARQPMTACGIEEAARLFALSGVTAQALTPSGRHVLAGTELLSARGPVSSLLRVWPLARTLVADTSGLASEVARIVTELRAAGYTQPLACTAQVFPGTRALVSKAVLSGGGIMYRFNLSDSLVLTPAQRVFVDGSLDDAVGRMRQRHPERRLVAEVSSLQEALAMAGAGAEVLELQGVTPEVVRACKVALHTSRLHPMLVVSGAVHAGNAVAFAQAGADMLVSAALPQAQPCEIEVRFSRAP